MILTALQTRVLHLIYRSPGYIQETVAGSLFPDKGYITVAYKTFLALSGLCRMGFLAFDEHSGRYRPTVMGNKVAKMIGKHHGHRCRIILGVNIFARVKGGRMVPYAR